MTDSTPQTPDGDAPQCSTPQEQLACGIQQVEAALCALEQLVSAHCDGTQPTTREAAVAAIQAFAGAHRSLTTDALQFAERVSDSDRMFASTRPRTYPHARARSVAHIVGTALLEKSVAGQHLLNYLQGAAARAQRATARLDVAWKAAPEAHGHQAHEPENVENVENAGDHRG